MRVTHTGRYLMHREYRYSEIQEVHVVEMSPSLLYFKSNGGHLETWEPVERWVIVEQLPSGPTGET